MPPQAGLPAKQNAGTAFTYNGHSITFDENRLIDVTAMWRAAGSPASQEFYQWRRKEGATFIRDLGKSLNLPQGQVLRTTQGRSGGSWAHWQIALAYAKYLSTSFHRYVNAAFREWSEEKADPDLKAQRAVEGYRSQGWSRERISARLEGVVARAEFVGVLAEHGVVGPGLGQCTDAINREVLGGSAREIKLARGLPTHAKTRDHLDSIELAALRFAEQLAAKRVEDLNAQGDDECSDACADAGSAVHAALAQLGYAR